MVPDLSKTVFYVLFFLFAMANFYFPAGFMVFAMANFYFPVGFMVFAMANSYFLAGFPVSPFFIPVLLFTISFLSNNAARIKRFF